MDTSKLNNAYLVLLTWYIYLNTAVLRTSHVLRGSFISNTTGVITYYIPSATPRSPEASLTPTTFFQDKLGSIIPLNNRYMQPTEYGGRNKHMHTKTAALPRRGQQPRRLPAGGGRGGSRAAPFFVLFRRYVMMIPLSSSTQQRTAQKSMVQVSTTH